VRRDRQKLIRHSPSVMGQFTAVRPFRFLIEFGWTARGTIGLLEPAAALRFVGSALPADGAGHEAQPRTGFGREKILCER